MTNDNTNTVSTDPRRLIAERPMTAAQIGIIGVLFCLNGLDGFDALALSFAAPGITREWATSPQALGIVISLGLLATGLGSLVVAPLADRIGRRPLIFLSLALMTAGMLVCAVATGITGLIVGRFLTGLGVGALVPCISAVAAEYSNLQYRDRGVIVMAIGFPAGGLVGGQISALLLQHFDWRSLFIGGGVVTGLLALAPLLMVPESIEYLLARRPNGALARVNAILARLGHPEVAALPTPSTETNRQSIFDILVKPALLVVVLIITLSYALHGATLYYSLNWIPKIVVDLSLSQSQAASVAAWCSGGGILGAVVAALLATRLRIGLLTVGALIGTSIFLWLFAHTPGDLTKLTIASLLLGAFLYGAQVSLYALMTRSFPVHVRATGVGFVTGVGRVGSITSPLVSGHLLATGMSYSRVTGFMALGSLLGGLFLAVTRISRQPGPPPAT